MPTDLWQDVRFATRLLIKDRWFTLAATTALALGIGANAAVFTFVNAVLVRGLPFHEADRIVTVWTEDDRGRRMNTSELDYEDWRSQARSFSELAATLGSCEGERACGAGWGAIRCTAPPQAWHGIA